MKPMTACMHAHSNVRTSTVPFTRVNLHLCRQALRREFLNLNLELSADADDLMTFDVKLNLLVRRVKNVEAELDKITSSVNAKLKESQDDGQESIMKGSSRRFFKTEQTVISLTRAANTFQQ